MSRGRLCDFRPHPYEHPDEPGTVAMHQIRARVVDDPTRTKHVWCRHGHNDWRMASDGKPPAPLANRLLHLLGGLRAAIRAKAELLMWTEGEGDASAGGDLLGFAGAGWYRDPVQPNLRFGPAVSHPFGANKATTEQAAHLAGYRGTVLVAVDDDDPGYACGLRRYELLRGAGLRARQIRIVRAADGIGGGLGMGADIADHARAGYGLRDLVQLRPGQLESGAERWAGREQMGAVYGADVPPEFTAEEWAQIVADSPLYKTGWRSA